MNYFCQFWRLYDYHQSAHYDEDYACIHNVIKSTKYISSHVSYTEYRTQLYTDVSELLAQPIGYHFVVFILTE
jgi:hypothetical protein